MKRELDFIVGADRTRIKMVVEPNPTGRVMVSVVTGPVTSTVLMPGVARYACSTVFIGNIMIECASSSEVDDIVAFISRAEHEIHRAYRAQRNQGAA